MCRFAIKNDQVNLSDPNAYSFDFLSFSTVEHKSDSALSLSDSLFTLYILRKKGPQTKHSTHAHHKTTPDDQLLQITS